MRRASGLAIVAFLIVGLSGCARRAPVQTVRVPPRIDLTQHELIGIVQFDTQSAGRLAPFATRRFTEEARQDQGLVRIVELGTAREALRSVGKKKWSPEAYQAFGRERGIRTLMIGKLVVSDVRPDVRLTSLRSGRVSAQVDATLSVRMIETYSGASIWSTSASATRSVGHISVVGGEFAFDAEDPEQAYGDLVNFLTEQVTRDFRATWGRQPYQS